MPATSPYLNQKPRTLAELELQRALGAVLTLITKHGLAVELLDGHPVDYVRLQQARLTYETRP